MVALRVLVCFAVLVASAVATDVRQCPDKNFDNLSENVQLTPCRKLPCRLKKGTSPAIKITFTPDHDIEDVTNHVTALVFGVDVPFVGVDGQSICDKITTESGEKASCPLKAGTKYVYNDTFPVLSFYPSVDVRVHWGLQDNGRNKEDIICFEVPARIA